MAFKVKLFTGAPDYETLHVAKLTCFPLEQRDYKPYSQVRICFSPDGLHLQLLAFEAQPLEDSEMKAVFVLNPNCPAITLSLSASGQVSACLLDGTVVDMTAHLFSGEDLQGVYWGGNLLIPQAALQKHFDGFEPVPDLKFQGNLYKLCNNPAKPHYGCFYPADFDQPLTAPENLGEFTVISF